MYVRHTCEDTRTEIKFSEGQDNFDFITYQ